MTTERRVEAALNAFYAHGGDLGPENRVAAMRAALAAADAAAWQGMVPVSIDPCLEKREPDEPMFILLGRDSAAPEAIAEWCELREDEIDLGRRPDTAEEREHIAAVRLKVKAFREWRLANRPPPPADSTP